MEVFSRKFWCFLRFMYFLITKSSTFLIYRFSPDEGPLISVIHQRQVKMYFHLKIQVFQCCRCYQWFLHLKQILLAITCQPHLAQPVRQQGIFHFPCLYTVLHLSLNHRLFQRQMIDFFFLSGMIDSILLEDRCHQRNNTESNNITRRHPVETGSSLLYQFQQLSQDLILGLAHLVEMLLV